MIQIVTLEKDKYKDKELIAEAGDVVEYHDESVLLAGVGYDDKSGYIITMVNITIAQMKFIEFDSIPETRSWAKTNQKDVETSPGVFEFISTKPLKYKINISSLTDQDKEQLSNKLTSGELSATILSDKVQSCILKQIDKIKVQ